VRRSLCALALLTILGWGCTPVRYREAADKDTYRIIEQKQTAVFGKAQANFSIEKQPLPEFIRGVEGVQAQGAAPEEKAEAAQPSPEAAAAAPAVTGFSEAELDKLSDEEKDKALTALLDLSNEELAKLIVPPPPSAVKVTLAQAVQLAVVNSREFQSQKEGLFLQALSLTYQRHLWRPQLGLTASSTAERTGDEKSIAADTKFSLGQAIASGAKVALNLGTNFAEFLTGDKRRALGSLLSFTFTQPFLKGGGRLVAMENLTQAERNVIYEVRSFARYQKDFSVGAAQNYYDVMGARDKLINTFRNYISLWKGRIRDRALQKEGKLLMLDVYESEQAELSGRNSWIFAQQQYFDQLDRFKINPLGLPTEAPIILDENELEVLRKKGEKGLPSPEVPLEKAVERALENRLDLITAKDALEDSERAVVIARDALRAGLDITVSSSAQTEAPTKAVKFQFDEGSYSAGLTADLPIDRKQERNAYRQALIALESQKRSFSLLRDNVKLEVRQAYRNLEQARQSSEIQKKSVDLAITRVDNAKIEKELGRKAVRDVLLAEDSLLRAQNDLTTALVNYEIARLRLRLSTEEMAVDERGLWVEEEITERGDKNAESAERTEGKKEELPKS
jgi:hypothetical protein